MDSEALCNGRVPCAIVGGRNHHDCLSTCFHDGSVRSPPRKKHGVLSHVLKCCGEGCQRCGATIKTMRTIQFLDQSPTGMRDRLPATNSDAWKRLGKVMRAVRMHVIPPFLCQNLDGRDLFGVGTTSCSRRSPSLSLTWILDCSVSPECVWSSLRCFAYTFCISTPILHTFGLCVQTF